jgi:competence protein ComEA
VADLVRPVPRPSLRSRVVAAFSLITPARLATTAGAIILVAVAAWWLLRSPAPPVEQSLPSARAPATSTSTRTTARVAAAPSAARASPTTSAVAQILVQAAGAVARPGVYHLASTARVADLLRAAGGPSADADSQALALAAPLTDGERVYVPRAGEAVATPGSAGSPSSTVLLKVNLNTATAEQLDALPGVGPAIAAAIVDYRTRHGPFHSVDDLLDVRGIGPAKLDGFRDLVVVG